MSYVVAKLLLGIGIWQFGVMGADQTIGTHEAPLMEVETCYLNLLDMLFMGYSPIYPHINWCSCFSLKI